MNKSYSDKLKDPRWKKLRREVLERDNYCCVYCLDVAQPLHCHHLRYEKGKEPWEYPIEDLITVCQYCHEDIHNGIEKIRYINYTPTQWEIYLKFHKDKVISSYELVKELSYQMV